MYRYENLTLNLKNMMYVLSEDSSGNGTIGFQVQEETLPWQGYFRMMPDKTIELAFDYSSQGNTKSAKLFKRSDGIWEGFDYDCRRVRLTKLDKLCYCEESKAWQLAEWKDQ